MKAYAFGPMAYLITWFRSGLKLNLISKLMNEAGYNKLTMSL